MGSCDLNQKVYSSIESYENKIFIQVSDGSLRAYTIKKNGNPDELWNRPFFTEENDKRNNEEWDPACWKGNLWKYLATYGMWYL